MKFDVVEMQKERIIELEKLVKDQSMHICDLMDSLQSMGMVLSYLTDEDFREFAFKLNYHRLISDFLENESNGKEWV